MTDTPTPISATDIGERIRQALDGTTPGPWEAEMWAPFFGIGDAPDRHPWRISHAAGTHVTLHGEISDDGQNGAGDAALIAAAPQLLADARAVIEAQERTIADLTARTTPPKAAHTVTLDSIEMGHTNWNLHCHHGTESFECIDPETGDPDEDMAGQCWLMSWWEAVGDELLHSRGPFPLPPLAVCPSENWISDDCVLLVLDAAAHPSETP